MEIGRGQELLECFLVYGVYKTKDGDEIILFTSSLVRLFR